MKTFRDLSSHAKSSNDTTGVVVIVEVYSTQSNELKHDHAACVRACMCARLRKGARFVPSNSACSHAGLLDCFLDDQQQHHGKAFGLPAAKVAPAGGSLRTCIRRTWPQRAPGICKFRSAGHMLLLYTSRSRAVVFLRQKSETVTARLSCWRS